MNARKHDKPVHDRRGLRIFLPFILLLLSFTALALVQQLKSRDVKSSDVEGLSTPKILFTKEASIAHTLTPDPTSPSTATPTVSVVSQNNSEPTASELPTHFPRSSIQISGPPSNSVFPLHTPVTMYWDWPFTQEQNQQFAIYLLDDSGEYLVGTADEPSLGNRGYQLNFVPGNTVNSEGTYLIEIRLEQIEPLVVKATSDPRAIMFTLDLPD